MQQWQQADACPATGLDLPGTDSTWPESIILLLRLIAELCSLTKSAMCGAELSLNGQHQEGGRALHQLVG